MSITIADFPARLEDVLCRKLGQPLKIADARRLTGGASRDTWLVEAVLDGERVALVIRCDMGGEITPDALSRHHEFTVLQRAFSAGVLVARPRWSFPAEEGMPAFLVVDRLLGESVGSRVVRSPALAEARKSLPRQLGEQLAKIHAIPFADLDFLPRPPESLSPAAWAVKKMGEQLHALGEPHPVLELALRRLTARAPTCQRPVLLHGDYRVGNLMVGETGLVGIFDWEFAHVGDPAEDLAWPCVRAWRFGRDLEFGGVGQADEFFSAYESARSARVDREAVRFWEMVGNLRWAVGCVAQAHRHLSGQASSVELASLGRRACEMELELLDLMDRWAL